MSANRPFSDDIIKMWETKGTGDYSYFEKVEPQAAAFWAPDSLYRKKFDQLDLGVVVELACGVGRHTAMVAPICEVVWATDTSADAIAEVAARFKDASNVRPLLVSGDSSLGAIETGSVDSVFTYDAMVHFEMLTVASYLTEISRILRVGGLALLHHSNYASNPEGRFTANPGWRNYMTADLMRHLASRNGLSLLDQTIIKWSAPESDALTILEKK
jgi:SAM-dependent methyltransferase